MFDRISRSEKMLLKCKTRNRREMGQRCSSIAPLRLQFICISCCWFGAHFKIIQEGKFINDVDCLKRGLEFNVSVKPINSFKSIYDHSRFETSEVKLILRSLSLFQWQLYQMEPIEIYSFAFIALLIIKKKSLSTFLRSLLLLGN